MTITNNDMDKLTKPLATREETLKALMDDEFLEKFMECMKVYGYYASDLVEFDNVIEGFYGLLDKEMPENFEYYDFGDY